MAQEAMNRDLLDRYARLEQEVRNLKIKAANFRADSAGGGGGGGGLNYDQVEVEHNDSAGAFVSGGVVPFTGAASDPSRIAPIPTAPGANGITFPEIAFYLVTYRVDLRMSISSPAGVVRVKSQGGFVNGASNTFMYFGDDSSRYLPPQPTGSNDYVNIQTLLVLGSGNLAPNTPVMSCKVSFTRADDELVALPITGFAATMRATKIANVTP